MQSFNFHSTAEEVLTGQDLSGKRILVTGVSSGLGVEISRALSSHGAVVVGAARDVGKAQIAIRSAGGSAAIELIELDLADLASVRSCADVLSAAGHEFDAVIANAGVMAPPFSRTADGFETQFGTNFLGHFVLVNRIAELFRTGGRLVTLSSAGHRISDVSLDDPNFEHGPYDPWLAYGRSKTAVALFAVAFDQRHRNRGVRGTTVHPGGIQTGLNRHMSPAEEQAVVDQINAANAEAGRPPFEWKSVGQGAATPVWAAVVASAGAIGARYCEDCHVARVNDGDGMNGGVKSYALDASRADALWSVAEFLVGEAF